MTTLLTLAHNQHRGTGVGGWIDNSKNYGVATLEQGEWALGITGYCLDHILDHARAMIDIFGADRVRIVLPDGCQGDHVVIPVPTKPVLRYR